MNRKRIFTLLLTLVMLLTSAGTVWAENNESQTAPERETVITPLDTDEYRALYAMGFLGDELTKTHKSAYITRAHFIGWLFRLAGYTVNTYKTENIPFIDVSIATPYCNEICTMYEMGRVNGTEPNMFSPDDHVTYSQACKLIIDVLGYRNYAEIKYGEYPEGYIMMAGELDINDGVKNVVWNRELTAEDAVRMLYNAGRAEVLKFAGMGLNGSPKYETDGTDLFAASNIYYGEGIMQSNGLCSIKEENAIPGVTAINGNKYENADSDFSGLLGCKVKYFYRDNKTSQKLLWATADNRFSNTLDLKAADLIISSQEYTLTNVVYYETNGKTENAKINLYADVIYNNSRCGVPALKDIQPKTGTMRLVDNNDDEIYDVVIVNEYDNLFVTHIVEEKEQIFAKYNKSVDFSDYDEVKIIKDGKEVTINDIDNQSIISYLVDKNKTILYLYPVNDSHKSVLKRTEVIRGRNAYTFEDGQYLLSNVYKATIEDPDEYAILPAIGKEYNFWLDIFGEIAEVQEVPGSLQYALLMSVRAGEPYEDYEAYTRLLLPDGNKVTGVMGKKVLINGSKKTGAEFLRDTRLYEDGVYEEGKKCMVQVVQVSFDEEGDLNKLNFASDTQSLVDSSGEPLYPYGFDVSTFSRDYRGKEADVRNQDGYILVDNRYLVTKNTLVFGKWNGTDESEPYEILDKGYISSGTYYIKDIYDVSPNMEVGAIYRDELGHTSNWRTEPLLVDSVEYVYENDEEVKRINGYLNGNYTSFTEEEPGSLSIEVEHGDLIAVSVRKNKLNNAKILLTIEEIKNKEAKEILHPKNSSVVWNGETTLVFEPLYRMDASSITIMKPTEWDSVAALTSPILTSPKGTDSLTLTIFDVKNDEIYRGDFFEMYHKYTLLSDGSVSETAENVMIYLRMRYLTAREIIVFMY